MITICANRNQEHKAHKVHGKARSDQHGGRVILRKLGQKNVPQ